MRLWLKEVGGGVPTIGTRIGREAGRGRRACEQTRSPKSIKTRQVEPDGTDLELLALPEEASRTRAGEESAEAVVAMSAGETRQERRAEGTRGKLYGALRRVENPPRRQPDQ